MNQPKKEPNGGGDPRLSLDLKHIRSLIELMVENDLSRIELREGESHILLRRGQPVVAASLGPVSMPVGGANPGAAAAPVPAGSAPAEQETYIRSPMVGTFYTASDPESPPFVSVGTVVQPDTVVCLIEAMKVFNELKAECAGRITKVLVKNAQAVEYDQPLFAVAPA
jgi:acetyl-CoA carboxylase biotin carboxyl carrier protein